MNYHPDPRNYTIAELVGFGFTAKVFANNYKSEFGNPYDWIVSKGFLQGGFDIRGYVKNFIMHNHTKVDHTAESPFGRLMMKVMIDLGGRVDPIVLQSIMEDEYAKIVPRWFEHG